MLQCTLIFCSDMSTTILLKSTATADRADAYWGISKLGKKVCKTLFSPPEIKKKRGDGDTY